MEHAKTLLPAIWREACRHIEIAEAVKAITKLLASHLPVSAVIVRRFDLGTSAVETIAVAGECSAPLGSSALHGSAAQRRHLRAWCAGGRIAKFAGGDIDPPFLRAALPEHFTSDALLVPLASELDSIGVLILIINPGERVTAAHRQLAAALSEPFSAALENDHRLRELQSQREATEAEREALLRRLGKDDSGDEIVGADAGLKPVMTRVDLVSRSDAPVLLLGETGSGKEVVARAIHNRSSRAHGPFIRVNCGAIPPELIDSELFGHEKGAFTGAASLRRGWFERADEGTLFLDEIGELPLPAQVRLLRILQEGVFERVGGEDSLKVSVRIIAATHRDLPAMVQQGKFREDLWYRIAVFPIVIPPLREHKHDIPELANHFARRAARKFGVAEVMPSETDYELLEQYDWPGNVRELASVLDRAVILGNGATLEIAKALGQSPANAEQIPDEPPQRAAPGSAPNAVLTLDDAMRLHIEGVLTLTRGTIEGPRGAAALLNINPHTLRARMRKLRINWARFRDDA